MKNNLSCPYCGCLVKSSPLHAWRLGAFIKPLASDTEQKGFCVLTFACGDCEREFFLNEAVFLDSPNNLDDEDRYPIEDWKYEVRNGDTFLGYEEWVEHRVESNDNTT